MIFKKYMKQIKLACLSLLVLITFSFGWKYSNPLYKIKHRLILKDYLGVVTVYNEEIQTDEQRKQVDCLITECLDDLMYKWNMGKLDSNEFMGICSNFSNLKSKKLSDISKSRNVYVSESQQKKDIVKKAEEAYQTKNYGIAMNTLAKIDLSLSKNHDLKVFYNQCKNQFLNEHLETLQTIEDYDNAIEVLKKLQLNGNDKEILSLQKRLEKNVKSYRPIYNILSQATKFYEEKNYKKAFELLNDGIKKYPENNKMKYAKGSYEYAYILTITDKVVSATEKNDYAKAVTILEEAIDVYDCQLFQDQLKAAKMKSDKIFFVKTKLEEVGNYIFKSTKGFVLGDFSEDSTILSLGGEVAASLTIADVPLDIRDLVYDFTHWGDGDYFGARLLLDLVGVVPIIGSIKCLKHGDILADSIKKSDKAVDKADQAIDLVKVLSNNKKVTKVLDGGNVVSDIKKKINRVSDLTSNYKGFTKSCDQINDLGNAIERLGIIYKKLDHNINLKLENMVHPDTGIKYVRKFLNLSDGRNITGVFPVFESYCDIKLPKDLWKASFERQKNYLNKQLKELCHTIEGRNQLARYFTVEELNDIELGIFPERCVWHHNEEEGLMQLVDSVIHSVSNHSGGMSIWGIGY